MIKKSEGKLNRPHTGINITPLSAAAFRKETYGQDNDTRKQHRSIEHRG
jgi:hypothetical protein